LIHNPFMFISNGFEILTMCSITAFTPMED